MTDLLWLFSVMAASWLGWKAQAIASTLDDVRLGQDGEIYADSICETLTGH
jgi:hypothetical protein